MFATILNLFGCNAQTEKFQSVSPATFAQIIADTTVIRLAVESRSHNFLMAVDGRSEKLYEGTELIIRKAPYVVNVVKLRSKRYFALLREKLMWGADQRG